MADTRIKGLYLAPEHPALSRTQFTERWRQHHEFGKTIGHHGALIQLQQCDVLAGGTLLPDGRCLRDLQFLDDSPFGVGVTWLSPDSLARIVGNSGYDALHADEIETFGNHVENFACMADEHVGWDDGDSAYKLFRFVSRHAGLSQAEFAERLRGQHLGHAREAIRPHATRYVQNILAQNQGLAASYLKNSSLSAYDAVIEVGFESLDAFVRMLAGHSDTLEASERQLVARDPLVTVMTKVNVLIRET